MNNPIYGMIPNYGSTELLPKDLLIHEGTLFEDFETPSQWIPTSQGTASANITEYKSGSKSIKVVINSGFWAELNKTVVWDLNGDWEQLEYWMYLHNPATDYTSEMSINITTDTGVFKSFIATNMVNLKEGWNCITWAKNSFKIKSGTPDWSKVTKITFTAYAQSVNVGMSYDKLVIGTKRVPAVMYSFDDGDISIYNNAFKYMKSLGIRGTLYMLGKWINLGAGYLDTAKILEMQAAGWTIGNHSFNHPELTSLTLAQQQTELAAGKTALDNIGATGGHYVAYPNGKVNANTRLAMSNLGYRLGSSTQPVDTYFGVTYPLLVLPLSDPFNLGRTNMYTGITLAEAKVWKDKVIENGAIWTPYFHGIGATSQAWSVADFWELVAYRHSEISHITIDDLYKLTTGDVTIPRVY